MASVPANLAWQLQAENNYAGLKGKPFFPGLCSYFASGPIVCMCWEGKDVRACRGL